MNEYTFNMKLVEIIDAGSGNAPTSFNRLKEQSGDIAVASKYLELALNQDCYKTRQTKREHLKITDAPFLDIRLQNKREIAYAVYKKILKQHQFPFYAITTTYSLRTNDNSRWLDKKDRATRWDRYEVERTNCLIRNKMREAFNIEDFYAFLEHHDPFTDKDGKEHQGRYHTHIISSNISDIAITEPNRKCRRYLNQYKEWINYSNPDVKTLKPTIIKSVVGSVEWVRKWDNSINIKCIWTEGDLANYVCYCLKTYTNLKSELCFNDVICNSSTFK